MTTYFEQGGYKSNRDVRFNSLQFVKSYINQKSLCIDHGQ